MNSRAARFVAGALLLVLAPSAAHARPKPRHPARAPAPPATARLALLERQLLQSDEVSVQFELVSTGAVESALRGMLWLGQGGTAECELHGTLDGRPVYATLWCDGNRVRGHGGDRSLEMAAPGALREAYLLGLTRMGLLPNMLRLAAGLVPEHAALQDSAWAVAVDSAGALAWDGRSPPAPRGRKGLAARRPARQPAEFEFGLYLGGEPAGLARLRLHPLSGLPMARRQAIRLASGQTLVTERYAIFDARCR